MTLQSITLQTQPFSAEDRRRIDQELQQAERRLRETVQALKNLGFRELYDAIELCEERIRSLVLGAYSRLEKLLEKCSEKSTGVLERIFKECKEPYLSKGSRRLLQLLKAEEPENAPLFACLFGDFLSKLPTSLVSQLKAQYAKVLSKGTEADPRPASIQALLEKRLALDKLEYRGQKDDSPLVKKMASRILKDTKKTLQESINRYFDMELPSKLDKFIGTTLKEAFIGTLRAELEYYLKKAMKKKLNSERYNALLQAMADPWPGSENTSYEKSIINVCDKVEGEIAKQFGKFKTSIPEGFRDIVLARVEELANTRKNPIADVNSDIGAKRKVIMERQWQHLIKLLNVVLETAQKHDLVTIHDPVYDAFLDLRAQGT
eukprot:tig00000411_g571.t2